MPGGLPTKFTTARADAICAAIARGANRKDAAEANGVEYQTLLRWIEKGEQSSCGQFCQFCYALTRAEAECAARMAAILQETAQGYEVVKTKTTIRPDGSVEEERTVTVERDLRAAESWWKRRRRDEWGDRVDGKVDVAHSGAVNLGIPELSALKELPLDELIRLHRETLGLPEDGGE